MSQAAKRRRGRPETPMADYGPAVRLANGTAVVGYRADPSNPQAPAMRAARAYVAYEFLGLPDPSRDAAERILRAAEAVQGARSDGSGAGGKAFWQCGGPTTAQVQAAADLRDVSDVLGRWDALAVARLVCDGCLEYEAAARRGLAIMAVFWRL